MLKLILRNLLTELCGKNPVIGKNFVKICLLQKWMKPEVDEWSTLKKQLAGVEKSAVDRIAATLDESIASFDMLRREMTSKAGSDQLEMMMGTVRLVQRVRVLC